MWSVLPSEVEENILSILPVKSLIRFRCVCKHWCNLFTNNPHFIKLQLNRSTQIIEGPKLFRAFEDKLYYIDVVEEACGNRGKNWMLQERIRYDNCLNRLAVSGSCNGLLCLSTSNCLYLLNPATKEYKKLPFPQDFCFLIPTVFGFGYSPRTDEYKVMIIDYYVEIGSNCLHCDDVYVYTLGTNSCWRSIGRTEYTTAYPRHNDALVNGALHWMASRTPVNGALHWMVNRTPRSSMVPISFDLGDEKFRELSLPKSFSHDDSYSDHSMGLVELGGFLSLYNCEAKEKFDIWVMKDYGDERSWTKVFSVPQSILSGIKSSFKPLYILKKDEAVLCRRRHWFFILDVVKKEVRSLHLSNSRSDYREERMCWESLVSLRAIGGMNRSNEQERREKEGGRSAVEGTGDLFVQGNGN